MDKSLDEAEVFDLEELSKAGKEPPANASRFRIRIDKESRVVTDATMTGAQILALVGKDAVRFKLVQRLRGGQRKVIAPDEVVDFRTPGNERFNTMAIDQTEGDWTSGMRRDFTFGPDDNEYLDNCGMKWEAVNDGGTRWLVLHGYPLPPGYTGSVVDVALQIPPGYPDAQIDMAYFSPALARVNGATQANATIGGRTFQRWSRHRTGENPWRPGVDSVATHMDLVGDWVARELRK